MWWSLLLLMVMGQCPFLMGHFYKYHFIKEEKNWTEAQTYCREHYTDLATVYDRTDMDRLISSKNEGQDAWIGLYNDSEVVNRTWHWSLPGVEYNDTDPLWKRGEPDNSKYPENCGGIRENGTIDLPCDEKFRFYCYDEKQTDNFTFISIHKTWLEAQRHCREEYTDLISGHDKIRKVMQYDSDTIKNYTSQTRGGNEIFVGLFSDSWRWSDGSTSTFRNWHLQFKENDPGSCVMVKKNRKWGTADCAKKKKFFCYEDEVILIKENKTWEEALYYCRDHYNDLVSISRPEEQMWVQKKAKSASSSRVWLGLRYTCTLEFWFWVSDKVVTFTNWDSDREDDCNLSGAMDRGGEHKWHKVSDDKEYNFICSRF